MQKIITLRLTPSEAASNEIISRYIASATGNNIQTINGFYKLKESIDARGKQIFINLTVNAFINEPFHQRNIETVSFQNTASATKKVIIVGAGPAGLFAALNLLAAGIQPIIVERGKDVRSRRRDLAKLNKEGIVNEDCNYCFGEGGAGTYSDGKLYTRSNKRGSIDRILNLFVQFGADEKILYQAHPHIGTNKLPHIITAMRKTITANGGMVLFEKKLTEFIIDSNEIKGIITATGDKIFADAVILATGHSARDVFKIFADAKLHIEAKPFALGVRVEHPQALIDSLQYHCSVRSEFLPPASYSLVQQVNEKGVFSFCMCPGGIIAPAATSPEELVVNGWSPSKRNNPFANSGMVAEVKTEDAYSILKKQKAYQHLKLNDPLLLMYFQQFVEKNCFAAGGGKFVAPAQRMADFCHNKTSSNLPECSYLPGVNSVNLNEALPKFIGTSLQGALKAFGNKMKDAKQNKSYFTNEAVLVATESRTSSPVRIPRNPETLEHTQVKNLYPCGEGAGYAGGIVSAAMDGERVAQKIIAQFA